MTFKELHLLPLCLRLHCAAAICSYLPVFMQFQAVLGFSGIYHLFLEKRRQDDKVDLKEEEEAIDYP